MNCDIAQSFDGQSFAVLVDGKVVSTHETIQLAVKAREKLEREENAICVRAAAPGRSRP